MLAPDRAKLYLTLVPYLAERGEVTVAEAAADFGVTPVEMRRMVEKLTVMGLPGESGFWQLDQDLFDINWDLLDTEDIIELTNTVALRRAPRLTAREAAALLSGLRLARAVPGVDDEGAVSALIAKLTRGVSAPPADVVVAADAPDDVRTAIAQAVRTGHAVEFTYRAPDADAMRRTVDPVTVHLTSGEWYLQGWCHLRRAMRTFHVARMSDAVVSGLESTHGHDAAPDLFGPSSADATATVQFAADLAPLLRDFLRGADADTVGAVTTAHLRVGDPRSLKRLAARLAGAVEVTAPTAARDAVVHWARAGLAQYDL